MRYVIGTALAGLAFGLVLRFNSGGAPVGPSMLVALVALPLFGLLVTLDDDLPGGWSNPSGTAPPFWRDWTGWAYLAARGSVSGIGFAIDAGWRDSAALMPWSLGIAGLAASLILHRRFKRHSAAQDV